MLAGRRVAGKLERAAVERHLADLQNGKRRGIYFDEAEADRACRFFPLLKLTDGEWAGRPFDLQPFQRFIVWSIFGWRRESDKLRRFRRVWISVARGNGKNPFAAALVLLLLAFDNPVEPRAECYTAATTKKQARILFADVKAFVNAEGELRKLLDVRPDNLNVPATGAKLEILAGDGDVADGLRIHAVTVDEFHAWTSRKLRELWNKIVSALGKRRQPMLLVITTAGNEESELWDEEHDWAAKVVTQGNGIEADNLFVWIAAIDAGDDPFDERNWAKANPMLAPGVVKIDHLRAEADKAKWNPAAKNIFLRYHCNTKVTSSTKLIPPELWALGAGPLPDLAGQVCCGGFDWGWKDDLAALAFAFPIDVVQVGGVDLPRYALAVDAWIPERTSRNLAEEPYATWIREGWLRVTPGDTTDVQAIHDRFSECQGLYEIRSVAMDPNNAREFGSRIVSVYGIEAYWFGQSHGKYNEPTRELLSALRQDRIRHGGNPLLAWAMDNVVASVDSRGYIKPDKALSKRKIDPACAVIMALSECLFGGDSAGSTSTGFVGTA